MRYFDRLRRALIKKSLLRGTSYTVSADKNQVALAGSAEAGIDYLEIDGNSLQSYPCTVDVSNATEYCGSSDDIDEYKNSDTSGWTVSVIAFDEGILPDGEIIGQGVFLPLPEAWQGEGVSFELVRKSTNELVSNINLYLAYGVQRFNPCTVTGFTPLFENGEAKSVTADGTKEYTHLCMTFFTLDLASLSDLNFFSDDYKLVVKKEASEPSPTAPIEVKCASASNGIEVALRESKLPYEYQEVEYIQSYGDQYIFTTFVPSQDTRIVADFQLTDIYASFVFGERSATSYAITFSVSGAGNFVAARHTSGNKIIAAADTNRHTVDYNKGTVTLDDAVYTFDDYTFEGVRAVTLFACADRNESSYCYLPSKMKLYSCKIYEDDVLVRSFVPCYKKLDYEAGLYDLVTNKFYENKGTGAFSFGNDVNTISSKDISNDEYYVDIARVQIPKRVDFENLFDISSAILTDCYTDDTGAIVASSSEACADIPLEAGEYTVYLEKNNSFTVFLSDGQESNTDALIASVGANQKETSFTYEGNNGNYLRLWWVSSGNAISNIRITKGKYTYAELEFAGIDGYKDKLIVDKASNKVTYLQQIEKLVLDGSQSFTAIDVNGYNEYCYSERLYHLHINACGLCTHFCLTDTEQETETMGFCPRGSMVFFRYDSMQSQEAFNAFLTEQYEKGTPVTVYYVRKEPVEFDLSNTSFAKELLSFNLPYEHNGGLVLEGDLDFGGISATYLATGYEDTAELKVRYLDSSGISLKDPRTYIIRKNSKYKIYAPEIEGYSLISTYQEGYIADGAETIIRYI